MKFSSPEDENAFFTIHGAVATPAAATAEVRNKTRRENARAAMPVAFGFL
jgi:hypothetical protein